MNTNVIKTHHKNMNTVSIKKLFSILESNAGKKITHKQLNKQLLQTVAEAKTRRGKPSLLRKLTFRKPKARIRSANDTESLEPLLEGLVQLGAIQRTKQYIVAKQPFVLQGRVSIGRQGSAFIAVTGAKKRTAEIFIPARSAQGVLPGDVVSLCLTSYRSGRFGGRIIRMLQRGRQQYRIRLLADYKQKSRSIMGLLLDVASSAQLIVSMPIVSLRPSLQARLKQGIVVVVSLNGEATYYGRRRIYRADFIHFEQDTELDPDIARILMKYNLPLKNTSDHSSNEVTNKASEVISNPVTGEKQTQFVNHKEPQAESISDWRQRRDLRQLYTITIDGATSKDFDDALSLTVLSQRSALLYVHIADVSYYVSQCDYLDKQAQEQGFSYYLANSVAPMLPPYLSEGLCSLVENKNRLAVTAEMKLDLKTGDILDAKFYRSIIRVNRRLTYTQVEASLDKANSGFERYKLQEMNVRDPHFESVFLLKLWDLAHKQRRMRMVAGRFDLTLPEANISYDRSGSIKKIFFQKRLKSSMLIEEFMLSANTSVAAFLHSNKTAALYRVHEPLEAVKLEYLNNFLSSYDIPTHIQSVSHHLIKKAMDVVGQSSASTLIRVFQMLLLRCFTQACYQPQVSIHWGLGFHYYCHFTSPIRRYPDLVVHRVLIALLTGESLPYTLEELKQIGILVSEAERRAVEAEREITKLKVIRYLQEKHIKQVSGFITGIREDRIFLEIINLPTDVIVEARHLHIKSKLELKDDFSVFIKALGRVVKLGEKWELEIEHIDVEAMQILCRPIFKSSKNISSY